MRNFSWFFGQFERLCLTTSHRTHITSHTRCNARRLTANITSLASHNHTQQNATHLHTDLGWCHALLAELLNLFFNIFGVQFQPRWYRTTVWQSRLGNTLTANERKLENRMSIYTAAAGATRYTFGTWGRPCVHRVCIFDINWNN